MPRPITIFTGQWTDLHFEEVCKIMSEIGYDGLEIASWGDHLDVKKAAMDDRYVEKKRETLEKYGLKVWAISVHLAGQLVCSKNTKRYELLAPRSVRGEPERMRKWAVEEVKNAALAAKRLGASIVTGFTGSSIWEAWYPFPPVDKDYIEEGFKFFARMWNPILDVFEKNGIKFALEIHPTEIAFDYYTAEKTLKAINYRESFGFNLDPSHLVWQGIKPDLFVRDFKDRIFHIHMKDVKMHLDGRTGILCSHLPFGDYKRGWNFVSLGHGDVDFEALIRALNDINYQGPLSVEWEDTGIDRIFAAREALKFVKKIDFPKSQKVFDESMRRE
ncbi:MAG: sugar phosphate isomerase/epimerase [Deltaproteobacteria bacterium]|nr:MAG: sugar phosphate isomerase/epimerase [Deltaproteobacteria bacterium]